MALTPGTRLGVFQLGDLLGRGGMGEVYRARDTKLDRDVAIKILPDAFAHDTERLARFTRESRTPTSGSCPQQVIGPLVRQTVFVQANSMYRADGPEAFRVGGGGNLMLGDDVASVLEAQMAASRRFRGIRHSVGYTEPPVRPQTSKPGMLADPTFRKGFSPSTGLACPSRRGCTTTSFTTSLILHAPFPTPRSS